MINKPERLIHALIGALAGLGTAVIAAIHLWRRQPAMRVVEKSAEADKSSPASENFVASAEEEGGAMFLRIESSAHPATTREVIHRQLAISIAAYRHIHQLGGVKLSPEATKDGSYQIKIKCDETDEMWAQAFGAIMRQHDVLLAEKLPRPKAEKAPMYWLHLAHKEMARASELIISDDDSAVEFMSCVLNIATYLAICLVRFGVVETFSYSFKEED